MLLPSQHARLRAMLAIAMDPETGKRTKAVFACSWQDQPLELIDFDNLDERQMQNHLQEKLSDLWVEYLFEKYKIERV